MSTKMMSLLLVASTVACYGWRTEALSPEVTTSTLAARMARVTLVDGRMFEVADPHIARDTLFARSVRHGEPLGQALVMSVSRIQRIETRHPSSGRTAAALTIGLVSVAAAAYIIVKNLSFDLGCFPACN